MIRRPIDAICRAVLADSCAVQNLLSSRTLHSACQRHGLQFVVTRYCLYECLDKPRKVELPGDLEIQRRLRDARDHGLFESHELTIEDLQEAAIIRLRRRVGAGELSTIALAKRFGIGVQTDDDKAEKLAIEVLSLDQVQSTPHVLGWLYFHGHLLDHELSTIVAEHRAVGRSIASRFEEAHLEACRVKLLSRQASE